jgi:hypothetical protein
VGYRQEENEKLKYSLKADSLRSDWFQQFASQTCGMTLSGIKNPYLPVAGCFCTGAKIVLFGVILKS